MKLMVSLFYVKCQVTPCVSWLICNVDLLVEKPNILVYCLMYTVATAMLKCNYVQQGRHVTQYAPVPPPLNGTVKLLKKAIMTLCG